MENKAIKKTAEKRASNAFFAVVSQFFITFTPLITTPFVTRELGAANIGIFSFTLTNVTYFQLFANLGIMNYGTRAMAEDGEDVQKISKHFWEIYGMQAINTLVMLACYAVYLFMLPSTDRLVGLIQGIWLLSTLLDINWFFYGIEEARLTAIREIIIKALVIIGVIFLVKKDFYPLQVYSLIMAGGNFLGMLVMMPFLKKYIVWIRPSLKGIVRHYRPNLILFIPLLAMSVFHNMDKTMLGLMTSYEELGFYYNADKIINVPLSITNSLGTVFLPRASTLLSSEDRNEAFHFLGNTFEVTILLSCALAFGIAGCAKSFIPLFFGGGFEPCIRLTYMFVPVLIVKSISNFYRMEYLVPTHNDRLYIAATFAGAAVNLLFNALLIPRLGAAGAVIGTLLAEAAVMMVQFWGYDKAMPVFDWVKTLCVYLLIACGMFGVMKLAELLGLSAVMTVLVQFAAGCLSYFVFCMINWKFISKNGDILYVVRGLLSRKPAES